MNRRVVTLVPILLGGAAGALLGLIEGLPRPSSAPSKSAISNSPNSRRLAAASAPSVGASVAERAPSAAEVPSSNTAGIGAARSGGAASASASAGISPPMPRKRAFDLSQPSTQEALLAAQVQCNRSSPEECERAAAGLESGSLGSQDAPRARSLRRIALTLYVKQCETGRPLACTRLAEMYEVGEIVQVNPRNAQALRTRVAELCVQHPSDPGCLP